MKYPADTCATLPFTPWQPSTWPEPPQAYTGEFRTILEIIFFESMLREIKTVIDDSPSLVHRGHVVALSILASIDTLASYAFRDNSVAQCPECGRTDRVGPRYQEYVKRFFPTPYGEFALEIYSLYRNPITHSWNLFKPAMLPGNEEICMDGDGIVIGLMHFFRALESSVSTFLEKLQHNGDMQQAALLRYRELRGGAQP